MTSTKIFYSESPVILSEDAVLVKRMTRVNGGTMKKSTTDQEEFSECSSRKTVHIQKSQQPPLTQLQPCSDMTFLDGDSDPREGTRLFVQPSDAESTQQSKRPGTSDRLSAFLAEMELERARIRSQGGFQLTTFERFRRRLRSSIPARSLFHQWVRILSILQLANRIVSNIRTNLAWLGLYHTSREK